MRKPLVAGVAALLCMSTVASCGAVAPPTPSAPPAAVPVAVVARDFAFDVPATITGGLVEFSFSNAGQEPHFAGFGRVAEGKTFEDVVAALTTPPSDTPPAGPPPFEDTVGFPTADPGGTGSMTANVEAGTYAIFCLIPSPDGTSHAVKGMVTQMIVTAGTDGDLPAAVGTVIGTDFELSQVPTMTSGLNVVGLRNDGEQLHEINLVELGADTTIEDVVAWYAQPAGPPPMRSLAGIAIKPGEEGTTEFDLQAGSTYALICAIPDVLGDFAPHIAKGMYSQAFTVT